MTERAAITQIVQLGKEVTPLTGVVATVKLQTMDFEAEVKTNVDQFRPAGFKFDTVLATEREWTEFTMKGQPTYTEIMYPLASVIKSVAGVNIVSGDNLGYTWTYSPSTSSADTPQTYTIEQGDSVRMQSAAGLQFSEFGLKFTREKVEMSGKCYAGKIANDNTQKGFGNSGSSGLTGGTATVPLQPILASSFTCYLDTTSGGLGGTKLGRLFSGDWMISNRFGPFWVVDASLGAFAGSVEIVPALTFKAILEADAAGMAQLDHLRTNTTYFLRIASVSTITAGSGQPFSLKIDMAVQVKNVGKFSDQEGIYAIEFEFAGMHDAGWTKALSIALVNAQSTLV